MNKSVIDVKRFKIKHVIKINIYLLRIKVNIYLQKFI